MKNLLGSRVAHDDPAVGCFGDDDPYGDCVEDCLETSFALTQGLFCLLLIIDIFHGAVPADNFPIFSAAWGGAGTHPTPGSVDTTNAVLNIERAAVTKGDCPYAGGGLDII